MPNDDHVESHPVDDGLDYQMAFRKNVFQLIKWAYNSIDIGEYSNSEEEDITGDLKNEIDCIIQSLDSPDWVQRYMVSDEEPINVPTRKGKRRKRLDIIIRKLKPGRRPKYCFEAKRLLENSHPISKYLGSEGLGEFLAGNYAFDEDEAGMLAYVQSGTSVDWAEKIHLRFSSDGTSLKVCPDGKWSKASLGMPIEDCYFSKHNRQTIGKPISLYHLFLSFC